MCPKLNQISREVQGDKKILKITLVVENIGGFGVKTRQKEGKLGAKFASKLMCLEFNQINEKLEINHRKFKKYLGCRKYWWFRSQINKKRG